MTNREKFISIFGVEPYLFDDEKWESNYRKSSLFRADVYEKGTDEVVSTYIEQASSEKEAYRMAREEYCIDSDQPEEWVRWHYKIAVSKYDETLRICKMCAYCKKRKTIDSYKPYLKYDCKKPQQSYGYISGDDVCENFVRRGNKV